MHCSPTSSCLSGWPTSSRTRRRSSRHSTTSLPESWRFDTWAVIKTVERDFGQWVRGQLILGFVVGFLTFVGLIVLSRTVDPIFGRYAVLLSVIAGLLELVPIIGPIISAVPAVLLAATAGLGRGDLGARAVLRRPANREQSASSRRSRATPSSSIPQRSSSRSSSVARSPASSGRSLPSRSRPHSATSSGTCSGASALTSPRRSRFHSTRIGMTSAEMPDAINPYKILQVDPEAEDEVITAAYRRLARKYHPDLAASPDAPARMAAINAAWELIGDPDKRVIVRPNAPGRAGASRRGRWIGGAGGSAGRERSGSGGAAAAGGGPAEVEAERAAERPPRPADPVGIVERRRPRCRRRRRPSGTIDSRHRQSSCRATGPPAGRRTVAASTNRCARRKATPVRRLADRRGGSSTSVATPAGRWARSLDTTSSTSSGSTGCRSAVRIATRSTGSSARPGAGGRKRGTPTIGGGCTGGGNPREFSPSAEWAPRPRAPDLRRRRRPRSRRGQRAGRRSWPWPRSVSSTTGRRDGRAAMARPAARQRLTNSSIAGEIAS